ncbi:MAG: hypothetical protein HYZ14_15250 [Bacteroidetes bacterium]|nr:hypothetical protein [Bacteroidota bacterium]
MKNFVISLFSKKAFFLCLPVAVFSTPVLAQHDHSSDEHPNVILHVNPDLKVCDFDIAPNLTQAEWARATREVGNAIYLDPLSSSKPLGRGNWSLWLEQNSFTVDQESGAWNNTFHHPDSTHWLTESGRLSVPAVRFQLGLASRWDAGIYYTSAKPFGANYGFLGVETKYTFLNDTLRGWYASARASYALDANVRDFNISSTGLDVMASKNLFNVFTPYAGIALNWNHGREVTADVDLLNENSFAARGIIGLDFTWKFVNLGYVYLVGDGKANQAFKLGVTF